MRVLLLLAHPTPTAFNHELARLSLSTLADLGHAVELADLYAEGFDPVQSSPEVIESERARLARADLLLCQFPIWWFRPPAMLLGWLEQVLPSQRFDGKRALFSVTAGGSPNTYRAAGVSQEPEVLFRPLLEGALGRSGFTALPAFVAWGMLKAGAGERLAHQAALRAHLCQWIGD
jgi:NAD(P)H dehydrogenase (quinone)